MSTEIKELPDIEEEQLLDDDQAVRLTFRQKMICIGAVIGAFFVFSIILFPYEIVFRYAISSYANGVSVDFTQIDFNIVGSHGAEGLRIATPDGSAFEFEEIESGIPLRGIFSGRPKGKVSIRNASVELPRYAFEAPAATLEMDLEGLDDNPQFWNGEFSLQTDLLKITRMPEDLPLPFSPDQIKIRHVKVTGRISEGNLNVAGTKLQSNLFNIDMEGTVRLLQPIEASQINVKVCLQPSPKLEEDNNAVYNMYIMIGGAAGGNLCFPISGSFAAPNWKGGSNG